MEGWGVFCSEPFSLIQTVCKRRFEGQFLDIRIFSIEHFFLPLSITKWKTCVLFLLGLVNGSIRASLFEIWQNMVFGTNGYHRKRYFSIVFSICRRINVILFKKLSVFVSIIPSVTPYTDIEWNRNTLNFVEWK